MDKSSSPETHDEHTASRQVLNAIFDNTKSSIFLVASDYRILFFNKFASDGCKLIYGKKIFVGDSLLNYRDQNDEAIAEDFKRDFQHAIEMETPVVREREMRHPQMQYWVRMEYTPIYIDEKLIGVLLNVTNISERKKFQIQNEEKHQQLVEIAWSQSHETRQPVSTLLGLINILDKKSLTSDNLHIVKLMEETAQKLDTVIQKTVIRANQISKTNYSS